MNEIELNDIWDWVRVVLMMNKEVNYQYNYIWQVFWLILLLLL